MSKCPSSSRKAPGDCCAARQQAKCCGAVGGDPFAYFADMIPSCLEYAGRAKAQGRPIVGMMCEYTPREIIMAAGAVPVCLCGGSAATIPAAEEVLPANLCPLIKSTFGYHASGSNPFLEMADLVVAETTCDGKKKMFELMAETRPMYVLELPQKADEADAREHWLREIVKLKNALESRFGVSITDEALRDAISAMNSERAVRRKLASLMCADAPPLTGRQLLSLKSSISCIPEDIEMYARALDILAATPASRETAGRVRVLMTGVPLPHGAERVLDIIEERGGLVVAMENCTGLKPIMDDVDDQAEDPLAAIAEKYFRLPCSVRTPNTARLDLIRRLAREYNAQCVIDLVWQACLTYAVESEMVGRLAREELGLPYMRIETDYSPSDSARIAVRVEALFETVKAATPTPKGG